MPQFARLLTEEKASDPPKRYTERGVGGWGTLTQNSPPRSVSRVVDGLSRLPSPHLKFSVPDKVEDVDRPLPQLRAPRGSVPSHRTHRGSQDPEPALPPPPQPLLLRLPHAAPSPPLQHRSGRQDGFQPGTAAVSSPRFCSLCLGSAASRCASDSPLSLLSPTPAMAQPLARGPEVGGRSG